MKKEKKLELSMKHLNDVGKHDLYGEIHLENHTNSLNEWNITVGMDLASDIICSLNF